MRRCVSRRALLAASAALVLTRGARAADPVDDVLSRIARARAAIRTIQGPFVQTRTIGLLSTDVRSTGTLTLLRPDRLRWELGPPDDVTFWIGPEGLAYRGAHGQARVASGTARIAGALDDLRALLGGDPSSLRLRWALRVLRDDSTGVELDAMPAGTAPLRGLRFSLLPDLVRPARALLVEGPRDRTVIEFGSLVVDAPVDAERMRPPRG